MGSIVMRLAVVFVAAAAWLSLPALASAAPGLETQTYTRTVAASTGGSGAADSSITVPESGAVVSVSVSVRVNSPGLSSVSLDLSSPGDGDAVLLNAGDAAQGQTDLGTGNGCEGKATFTDSAATSLASAAPPYAGSYRPWQALSGFKNEDSAGKWTLTVDDDGFSSSAIVCWTLTITRKADVARAGSLEADLTYLYDKNADFDKAYTNVRLRIANGAQTLYTSPVVKECKYCTIEPDGYGRSGAVEIRDVTDDGKPEVLTWLYTGGAHCCSYVNAYRVGSAGVQLTSHWFSDFGAAIKKLSGRTVFEGLDERFAYAFTDYADSYAPIQIWQFRPDGTFADITHRYRTAIAADAASLWRVFQKQGRFDSRGVLAAWAADQCRLGRGSSARATVARIPSNELSKTAYPVEGLGAGFAAKVFRQLARWGYQC